VYVGGPGDRMLVHDEHGAAVGEHSGVDSVVVCEELTNAGGRSSGRPHQGARNMIGVIAGAVAASQHSPTIHRRGGGDPDEDSRVVQMRQRWAQEDAEYAALKASVQPGNKYGEELRADAICEPAPRELTVGRREHVRMVL